MPLALLGVSPARESPSCCDRMRGIQLSQSRATVTGLRKRVLRRESSLMRHAIRVTRKAAFLFAVLTTAVVWSSVTAQPAQAQSQDRQKEIQQLKDELQQMEQTMGEVKARINALETAPSPSAAPAQRPAKGQKTVEQPEPVIAIPSEAVIRQGTDPVPIEGEITEKPNTVSIYGFAMLDSGYDFGQIDPNWYDVVRPTKLPSFTNQFA